MTAASALEPMPFLREHTQSNLLEECERQWAESGLCMTASQPQTDGQVSPADTSRGQLHLNCLHRLVH